MRTAARVSWLALLASGLSILPPAAAAAETEAPAPAESREAVANGVAWQPRYRRAGPWDAIAIGGAGALYLTEALLPPRRGDPLWEGPILLDEAIRDLLVVDSRHQRASVGTVSDVMVAGSLVQTMVVDNLIVAWGAHGAAEVALQMSVANAEAYAFAFTLNALVKRLSGRARPYAAECERDPGYGSGCDQPDSNRSFFSGHTATTAVGAGLLCAHHLELPLYRYPEVDAGVCAAGIALTLATGAMRIASDNHWASDVAVGYLVGFASGYLIPTLFFYRFYRLDGGAKPPETVWAPTLAPHSVGLRVRGVL